MNDRDIELESLLREILFEAGLVSIDFLHSDKAISGKNIQLAHITKTQKIHTKYQVSTKERIEASTGIIFGPIYFVLGLLFIAVTINNFENIRIWYESLIAGFVLMLIGILSILLANKISSNTPFLPQLTIVRHNSL